MDPGPHNKGPPMQTLKRRLAKLPLWGIMALAIFRVEGLRYLNKLQKYHLSLYLFSIKFY